MRFIDCEVPHYEWINNPSCIAGFSTRMGGVSCGIYESLNLGLHSNDEKEKILENRHRLFSSVAPMSEVVALRQVHSARIVEVDDHFQPETEADGFYTTKRNVFLSISIADCGSIVFHDADFSIVAALHCGWRGTRDGIIQNMIEQLSQFAELQKLTAYIGPMIQQEHYEVGEEFLSYFPKDFFVRKNQSLYFDLNGLVVQALRDAHVGAIYNAHLDTYSNSSQFFSYRRDGLTGRMCSYIGLK